ncbi:MAG: CBS domain-containing protein [Patescibacteria group bacterium]|jgi:CBS domain-containing protein/sporulation protein YlmC with PRC-barrel domain
MLYFSELNGLPVYTSDNVCIGTLKDMIFELDQTPRIKKIVVEYKHKTSIIHLKLVRIAEGKIIVSAPYESAGYSENELYVGSNLLDKQIIDLVGNKMVRVNDVVLLESYNTGSFDLFLMGVDIGVLGIMRRLHLERPVQQIMSLFSVKPSSQFLSWADIQPLELSTGEVKLKKVEGKLRKMRPEDLADYLERTNEMTVHHVLKMLGTKQATDVVENLDVSYQKDLFTRWDSKEASEIIEHMDPDEAVDVLSMIPKEKAQEVIGLLSLPVKKKLQHLIRLSVTPIGGLVTNDFITADSHATSRDVINKIRKESMQFSCLNTVYVLNEKEQLVGVFSLHELLLANQDELIFKFMNQNLVEVLLTTPVHIAIHKMLKYHVSAVPVIDNERRMVGLLTIDDVSEYIEKKIFK